MKKEPDRIFPIEYCQDGDSGEHQIVINLGTKIEKRKAVIAEELVRHFNAAENGFKLEFKDSNMRSEK